MEWNTVVAGGHYAGTHTARKNTPHNEQRQTNTHTQTAPQLATNGRSNTNEVNPPPSESSGSSNEPENAATPNANPARRCSTVTSVKTAQADLHIVYICTNYAHALSSSDTRRLLASACSWCITSSPFQPVFRPVRPAFLPAERSGSRGG